MDCRVDTIGSILFLGYEENRGYILSAITNEEELWEALILFQNAPFFTAKKLEFTYTIKGNEMFVSRRGKSITRATINLAFQKAADLQRTEGTVAGPKKLNCFGASYLYPIFIKIGVIDLKD